LPEFQCQHCQTLYHSEKDEGECPLCKLSRLCGLPPKDY
jgi:rubrerythrin